MKFYEHIIEVWGRFPFPLDMLRYDNCVLPPDAALGADFGRWGSYMWNARTPR